MLARLTAAGWPERIGPNDKAKTCRNRLNLDGAPLHVYWTRGYPFFAYDPALQLITTGNSRDAALIAMVHARESGPRRDSGPVGEGRNEPGHHPSRPAAPTGADRR